VTTLPIIKHFDIFKNIHLCFLTGFITSVMNELHLERMEKTLSHRITPTVALTTYTEIYSMNIQQGLKIVAGILDPRPRK